MLDIRLIRDFPEKVKENIARRHLTGAQFDVDQFLRVDNQRTELIKRSEMLRGERNRLAEGREKPTPDVIAQGKKIKEEIKVIEGELAEVEKKWQWYMDWFPNVPHEAMPDGKDGTDNQEIKRVGDLKKFNFVAQHHLDLGEKLGLIEVERAGKISGSRFFFLQREAVLMQWGIFDLALKKLLKRGFDLMIPPVIVKSRPLYGTGYFPADESQIYELSQGEKVEDQERHFLVGTSEQALVSYHMDEVININDERPLRYGGISTCFRSEAGSWGKDVRGIKRVHQFDKVEMIYFTTPASSQHFMAEALEVEEEILTELGLTYHVLEMCTGDVGLATHRKFDVEVWMPSSGEWMETHSDSDLGSYHARRLNIKYRTTEGKLGFPHTISATAITNSRPIAAIIDNYQQEDGSVVIPEVLRSYVGKDVIGSK